MSCKGPVISKKFIGFNNLMSWSAANQSKQEQKKWQITTSLISNKPQLKIGHAITSIKSTTVQQLKLDFTIPDLFLSILFKATTIVHGKKMDSF